MLPVGVKKVYFRSDTAGYQHDLLRYCEHEQHERFGRIEFAIGADVTKEFKKAVTEAEEWKPVMKEGKETNKEWAEVCFVPNTIGSSKNGPTYRYLATRELLRHNTLPGYEGQLPFPTMTMDMKRYKVFGVVTNRDLVVDHGPFAQPHLSDEISGAEGIMDRQKNEGVALLPYQPAGKDRHEGATTRDPHYPGTSLTDRAPPGTATNHGACSCLTGVSTPFKILVLALSLSSREVRPESPHRRR